MTVYASPGEHWRHKKSGTVYEIVTDTDDWTVYRNVKTGAVWVRPTEEFMDGRFERVVGEGLDR